MPHDSSVSALLGNRMPLPLYGVDQAANVRPVLMCSLAFHHQLLSHP